MDNFELAIRDRIEELEQKLAKEHIIPREIEPYLQPILNTDLALVITGHRRVGKSILAYKLSQGKGIYINFEDERLQVKPEDLNKVLEAAYRINPNPEVIVLDEIQNIGEGWERFVSRLLVNKKVIITGSNARLLSKEMATYLTGRHIDFTLFPFSFKEFLTYHNIPFQALTTSKLAHVKEALKRYLDIGGLPLAQKVGRLFLATNLQDVLQRDVLMRYNPKYPQVLMELAHYYLANFGRPISFNKLKNILQLKSPHTVAKYTMWLENAYLFFFIKRFSYKRKEHQHPKPYVIDNGYLSLRFSTSADLGRKIENLVAIELMRRKAYWHRDWELYYYKDRSQHEVDFLIKEGPQIKELIQVTYASARAEISDREIKNLQYGAKKLNVSNLTLISWDYEEEIDNIKVVPLWKWLLAHNQRPDSISSSTRR